MKVYISGPITGTSDYQKRFARAEEYLRQQGYEVINPARVNASLPKNTKRKEYMKLSIDLLDMCEMIFMLRGWRSSKGARTEHEHAADRDIHTIYEKEEMYE